MLAKKINYFSRSYAIPNLWFFKNFISANIKGRSMKLLYSDRYNKTNRLHIILFDKIKIYQIFNLQKHE